MTALYLILLVLAAACFLASAFWRDVVNIERPLVLVSLGLAFWVLVPLIHLVRTI